MVSRIAPTAGTVGQRVDVYGSNFRPGDRVGFAGVWADILQLQGNRIRVRVPEGAKNGPIVVRRGKNLQGVSKQEFQVLYGPVIHSFSPTQGDPGTEVTIKGEYFGRDAQVSLGNVRLRVLQRRGDRALVVRIPRNVASGARFQVRTRTGRAISDQRFEVYVYPTLANMQPRQGYPGTRVTLNGKLLDRVDSVLLGNAPLVIISKQPRRIVAEIPGDAQNGWISFSTYGKVRRTNSRFQVLSGPIFEDYYPKTARAGSRITISGRNFDPRITVSLGKEEPLRILRKTRRQLVVKIPDRFRPGAWHLRLRTGPIEVVSPTKLQILPLPYIDGVSASWVWAGAKFTINGEYYNEKSRVYWGQTELKIASLSPDGRRIEVHAPRNQSGQRFLWIDDGNGRYRSPKKLEVRPIRVRDHRKKPRGGGY